jgi:putative GTP pyrophosphokinase
MADDISPWGSKGRINRAGDAIRDDNVTDEDTVVLDAWRAGHTHILNTFQALLRNITKRKTGIIVAQRLKRRLTIADKLSREPEMQLARMDDVAGCRLIFPTIGAMNRFRKECTI